MEVVWSGELERASVERERRNPPPVEERRPSTLTDQLLAYLQRSGPSTMSAIAEALGETTDYVNSLLWSLCRRGLVEKTDGAIVPGYGRRPRFYRAVGELK